MQEFAGVLAHGDIAHTLDMERFPHDLQKLADIPISDLKAASCAPQRLHLI
jgi:hypothetical protein